MRKLKRSEMIFLILDYGILGGFLFSFMIHRKNFSEDGLLPFFVTWAAIGMGLFLGQLLYEKSKGKHRRSKLYRAVMFLLCYGIIPVSVHLILMSLTFGFYYTLIADAIGVAAGFMLGGFCVNVLGNIRINPGMISGKKKE